MSMAYFKVCHHISSLGFSHSTDSKPMGGPRDVEGIQVGSEQSSVRAR